LIVLSKKDITEEYIRQLVWEVSHHPYKMNYESSSLSLPTK
jgi:hypothetical protein